MTGGIITLPHVPSLLELDLERNPIGSTNTFSVNCNKRGAHWRSHLTTAVRILLFVLTVLTLIHIGYTVHSAVNKDCNRSKEQHSSDVFHTLFSHVLRSSPGDKYLSRSLYFIDCIRSFKNRDHALNDGVSVKIGVFSHWTKAENRQQIRDTTKAWLPSNGTFIDFEAYCTEQEQLYRSVQGADALQQATSFIPVTPSHSYWPSASFSYACTLSKSQPAATNSLDRSWLSIYDNIDFVFVFGHHNDTSHARRWMFQAETELYGDLEHLKIAEGVNGGKSLEYFQKLARENLLRQQRRDDWASTAEYEFDYVMKVDDDSFLHLPHYIEELRGFRTARLREVYYGQLLHYPHTPVPPALNASSLPMWAAGAGYTLSNDLMQWLLTPHFDTVRARLKAVLPDEDLLFGEWFRVRGEDFGRHLNPEWQGHTNDRNEAYRRHKCLVANFINMMPRIYNYPGEALTWAWARQAQFHPQTVIVHYTKQPAWWNITTRHFMCQQPHVFIWNSTSTWWTKAAWGDLIYKFNDDSTLQYSNEYYDEFHQAYREQADLSRGLIGERVIVIRLGNLAAQSKVST